MKRTAFALASGLVLACALPTIALPTTALAHGATHAQHGGVVQMNGETLFELVRAPAGVTLYVMDEDEPVAASGMAARLTVSNGRQRREVNMVAGARNQFFARGVTLPRGASVGVLVINRATQARYGTTFLIK